ncbi:hypothetical protein [Haloplanus halophilus]|uniref:hypothetical protein n=1 Tax=Haloplanus halophilus TaxID=2949993 RepID=UPI00203EA6FC|nr:hypothetical protein [Haloplanus sp. GDY1]
MHRTGSTVGKLAAAVTSIVLTIVTVATGEAPVSDGERGLAAHAAASRPVGCPVRSTDTAWGGASA